MSAATSHGAAGGAGRRWGARARLPVVAAAVFTLLLGVLGGLARLGWPFPDAIVSAVSLHGVLMVSGFFGALIGLERAVALGRRWGYLAPLLCLAGALHLALGGPQRWGFAMLLLGAVAFTAATVVLIARGPLLVGAPLVTGAVALVMWTAAPLAGVVPQDAALLAVAFLVATVLGERLFASRLVPGSALARHVGLVALVALVVAAAARAGGVLAAGPAAGALLVGLALLVAPKDVARRTVRQPGLPRFAAIAMGLAYGWLVAGGALVAWLGLQPGPRGDAALHALFLGFAFSMVLGHANVVFPAVAGVALPFSRALYVPLVALHAAVLFRVGADLIGAFAARRIGGLLTALALATFVVTIVGTTIYRHVKPSSRRNNSTRRVAAANETSDSAA